MNQLLFIIYLLPAMLLPVGEPLNATTTTASVIVSRSQNSKEIAEIESYSKQLDRSASRSMFKSRFFADISSDEETSKPRWREYRTKRELDRAWQNNETYTSAGVWMKTPGDLVIVDFTLSSPSGDWAQYVRSYYRADGTLAKTHSEVRTFYGEVIIIRDRLYDAQGKLLNEKTSYLDLTTRKPKKVNEGDYADQTVPHYPKVSELPFYTLLKKR